MKKSKAGKRTEKNKNPTPVLPDEATAHYFVPICEHRSSRDGWRYCPICGTKYAPAWTMPGWKLNYDLNLERESFWQRIKRWLKR